MLMKSAVIGLLLAPVVWVTEIQRISICCGQQPCFCSELDILICTERPRSQFEQTGSLVLAAIVLELEIEPVSYLSWQDLVNSRLAEELVGQRFVGVCLLEWCSLEHFRALSSSSSFEHFRALSSMCAFHVSESVCLSDEIVREMRCSRSRCGCCRLPRVAIDHDPSTICMYAR